jgi:hypothetical protein
MHRSEVFAAPYSAGDGGFRVQAVAHLVKALPARTMLGLRAGSVKVPLPALPVGVSSLGIHATNDDGYTVACDNVSSLWLAEYPQAFDAYLDALCRALVRGNIRMDGDTRRLIRQGTVEMFVAHDGDTRFDRLTHGLKEDGDYRQCIDLLRQAPFDGRCPLAFAPGGSPRGVPSFMLGTQSWLDGPRLLIEYKVEDTGKSEIIALDRRAFVERLEQAFHAMLEPFVRLRAVLPAHLDTPTA